MLWFVKFVETKVTRAKHLFPSYSISPTQAPFKHRNKSSQTCLFIANLDSDLATTNQGKKAIERLLENPQRLDFETIFSLLKASSKLKSLRRTKRSHSLLLIKGFYPHNITLLSQLINAYVNCDSFQEALLVFNHLPKRSLFAYNSIIKGFINQGLFVEALELYSLLLDEGLIPDNFTFPCVLKACAGLCWLEQGKKIHEFINFLSESSKNYEPNMFVDCALIDMYEKCESLIEAQKVFEGMPYRDLVSWTAMICGTVHNGHWLKALVLFSKMRAEGIKPDPAMLSAILPACSRSSALPQGKMLHSFTIRSGIDGSLNVMNALVDMYSKCNRTQEAWLVFLSIEDKDLISWSSMIAGYSQNGEYKECLELFLSLIREGIRPNSVIFPSVLPCFGALNMLNKGKEVHCNVIRNGFEFDVFVGSSLIDMYARCGCMKWAELVFEIMQDRDVTIWNSIINGYAECGDLDKAFILLRTIRDTGTEPNSVTIVSVLPLCTSLATLQHGREIHGYAIKAGLGSVVNVGNALIDLYCKCGHLELGLNVFGQMRERDIVTYNSIIAAHGMHGNTDHAFSLFNQMERERVEPNKVTFLALLSACSHGGLVERGRVFFNSMTDDYGIKPEMEHYACMVDMLGRSGCLDVAWEFIKAMKIEPGIDVLGSLLGACRVYNRIDIAEKVSEKLFKMEQSDAGYYVLLSNIYAASGRLGEAMQVRKLMRERGISKNPGVSWVEVGGSMNSFLARDRSHPDRAKAYEALKSLILHMKNEGYAPDISFSLLDIEGHDEKEGRALG
ncbi:hypothetical protein AMTRI_Chr02g266000 [Amborella trichopoda]